MSATAEPEFIGWHRVSSRSPWFPVCHGHSPDAVLSRLLDLVSGDRAVTASGTDPNQQPHAILRASR